MLSYQLHGPNPAINPLEPTKGPMCYGLWSGDVLSEKSMSYRCRGFKTHLTTRDLSERRHKGTGSG